MPPKGFGKIVSKKCSQCKRQAPVATRVCTCGFQFIEGRRKSTTSNPSEQEEFIEEVYPTNSLGLLEMKSVKGTSVSNGSPIGMEAPEGKRRSERVKREKPNFYDSTEFDNKRKARKGRHKDDPNPGRLKRDRKLKHISEHDDDDDDDDHEILKKEKKKRKKKKKKKKNGDNKDEEVDEEIMAGITPEKEQQFSIVLDDINFKLGLNNPKFIKIH